MTDTGKGLAWSLSDGAPTSIPIGPAGLGPINLFATPMRAWVSPRFHGLENIPATGPALLVANHSLVALDCGLLIQEIVRLHGRVIRGLGDHGLMESARLRGLAQRVGSVRGSRENLRALLELGELVLVLPGGSREAFRRKHERYTLKWEGRNGFARAAIEAGVPIIPVAMVGANDAYDVVIDGEHPIMAPMRWIARRRQRPTLMPPVFRGLGPTLLPKPQRFYFSVGTPIDASAWRAEDLDRAEELRQVVQVALEKELNYLFAVRDRDRGRTLRGRLREAIAR
ncbi:lysophospholipid acyltransferase family protein [Nocardia sp. NPDC055321]